MSSPNRQVRPASSSSLSVPREQAQRAALKGASLAFQKQLNASRAPPAVGPKPADHHGALVAATSAASLSKHTTGGSAADAAASSSFLEHSVLANRLAQLQRPDSPHLRPPPGNAGPRSASFIAATLAASRSTSPSPSPSRQNTAATQYEQKRAVRRARAHSGASSVGSLNPASSPSPGAAYDGDAADEAEGVGPATLRPLVRRHIAMDPPPSLPARSSSSWTRHDGDPVKSPSPRRDRESSRQREILQPEDVQSPAQISTNPNPNPNPKPKPKPKPKLESKPDVNGLPRPPSSDDRKDEARPASSPATGRETTPSGQVTSKARNAIEEKPRVVSEVLRSKDTLPQETGSTGPITLDEMLRPRSNDRSSSVSSDDTFFSTSSGQRRQTPPPTPPPARRTQTRRGQQLMPQSGAETPASPPEQPPRPSSGSARRQASTASSGLALDSLTSAIVAGSLASARHTPVSGSQTPLLVASSTGGGGRSPPRRKQGMLQTLRAPQSKKKSDDEEARKQRERHRKRGALGGKKHVHHEGSRRRWRDSVSPDERRRYEALWASNRGLLLSPGPDGQQDLVVNVVVRDLWSRSRLPFDELAEVWDLVDLTRRGALSKEEFVVGMWLIDMRLRGRKIPLRVSQSVWDSVKVLRVPPA